MKKKKISLYTEKEIAKAQSRLPFIMFYPDQSLGFHHGISIFKNDTVVQANRSILAVCVKLTNGQPAIVVDDYFLQAPERVRDFILSHEAGHLKDLLYGETKEVQFDQITINTMKRLSYLFLNKVDSRELIADKYAVDLTSKQDGIEALSYIRNTFKTGLLPARELNLRIKYIQNLK